MGNAVTTSRLPTSEEHVPPAPMTDDHDNNEDESELRKHAEQFKQECIMLRASCCILNHRGYITASNGLDCMQDCRFQIYTAYDCNMFVYLDNRDPQSANRARVALATHKANPTLLLGNRVPFLERRTAKQQQYPPKELDQSQLDGLIRNPLMLCDFLEAKSLEDKSSNPDLDPAVLPPMQRAVFMLYWPPQKDSEILYGHAAVVRTGESRLCSGSINLDSLREHEFSGFLSNENIAHVSLVHAVQFLSQLDIRETAANISLRTRNYIGASARREMIEEEARERLALSKGGDKSGDELLTLRAYDHASRIRGAREKWIWYQVAGYSDVQAMLASCVAIMQLDGGDCLRKGIFEDDSADLRWLAGRAENLGSGWEKPSLYETDSD